MMQAKIPACNTGEISHIRKAIVEEIVSSKTQFSVTVAKSGSLTHDFLFILNSYFFDVHHKGGSRVSVI